MWMIEPTDSAVDEMLQREIERAVKEVREKMRQRTEWLSDHPPCPHCGKQDPLPPWLQ